MTSKEHEQYMDILKNYNISDGYTIVYDDGSKREVTKQELYDDLYGDIFSTANDNWYSDHSSKNWKRIACFIINGHKVPYDVVQEINNDEFDAKHRFDDEYEESSMKKLNITKEQFNRSNYFQNKYGKLEYVSESGKLFKTDTGKVLKFVNESLYGIEGAKDVDWAILYKGCKIEPTEFYGNLGELYDEEHPEDTNHEGFDDWCWKNQDLIRSELEHLASYDDEYEGDDYYAEGGIRKELVPQNGRKSFGHKAAEEEDDDGFTLFSYNTPVARLERSDDGSHLDFILLNDYLSGTTMNHIHSFLISHKQDDIPAKKLKMMQVGDRVPLMAAESRKKLAKESENHRYSIKFVKKGWDCSVQEDAPSEEEAIAIAVDKGKIRSPKDVVKVTDLGVPGSYWKESKKLVKEGAGAGYTVHIKNLKFGSILDKKYVKMEKDYESYYECQVEIMPGEYEIAAEDYYNDFFWQEHEFGDTPTAKIDGGIATISYSTNSYDEDEAEDELRHEVARRTMDICFDYGHGWVHADLSRDKIEADHVEVENSEFYGSIDKIELNAPDLADAVNCGYQSTFDQGEDEENPEDEEPVNEVSGWKLEDEDLTLVNSESDGDKLYIVKLWWGSGYMTDNYNAYAFNEEEALNYVVAYIEKHDPETLAAVDEIAKENENDEYFDETFMYVDATMEGASEPHYIWAENLTIAEYPRDHKYPMSKDVKRR